MDESRHKRWRNHAEWFAAESLVVIAGVLIALAFQSWYQARQDRERERTYVRQVLIELHETQTELEADVAEAARLVSGAKKAQAAFFQPTTPPLDSLVSWWKFDHADPMPTFGTLRAIIGTGDLRLIPNDSIRDAIVWISERAHYYDDRLRRWEGIIIGTEDAVAPFRAAMDLAVLDEVHSVDEDSAGMGSNASDVASFEAMPRHHRQPEFVKQIKDYLDDPAVYTSARLYLTGSLAHKNNMERLLADVRLATNKIERHR